MLYYVLIVFVFTHCRDPPLNVQLQPGSRRTTPPCNRRQQTVLHIWLYYQWRTILIIY